MLTVVTKADASYGAYGCQSQYGGNDCPQPTSLIINKTVQKPGTTDFVDNLGWYDPKYAPTQQVNFKVTVTNSGNKALSDINVVDYLPDYLVLSTNDRTVTQKIDKLEPGQSKTLDVSAKVVAADKLPSDKVTICDVVNKVTASVSNTSATDEARFCIEKQTLGSKTVQPQVTVPQTPATGAETLGLLALIPSALAGLALRKKTN